MKRLRSLLIAALSLASFVGTASADYWSPYVSEEDSGRATWCNEYNQGAIGFGCSGSYCDSVHLLCQSLPTGVKIDAATNYWSEWMSEEDGGIEGSFAGGWYGQDGDTYHVCNYKKATPGIVNSMKCSGSYCDKVAVECGIPKKTVSGTTYAVGATNCAWTSWRSEENASVSFGVNRFITGVECSGSYCDSMRFYVCTFDGTKLLSL